MDLNDLFITLVLVNCLWLLFINPSRFWVGKSLVLVALLGVCWWFRPDRAGWDLIGPWAVFVMLPMWLQHGTIHFTQQRRFRSAQFTSSLLSLLHPVSHVRSQYRMIRVLRKLYQGDLRGGGQLAKDSGLRDQVVENLALVLDAQVTGDWNRFLDRVHVISFQGMSDPVLLGGVLQAHATQGDWEGVLRCLRVIGESRFTSDQNASLELRAFGLLGDLNGLSDLLISRGHSIAWESREYWTAVAEQINGATERAQNRLRRLLPRATPVLRPLIERTLAVPAVGPVDSSVFARAEGELGGIRSTLQHDARYAVLSGDRGRWPIMTMLLAVVIIGNYWREIPGGSENTENLVRLGALEVPLTGEPGEWTHVFTSGFLHFGPIHLALNLLGLAFLGGLLERAWGALRMLIQFLVCIVSSASLLPWVTTLLSQLDGWIPGLTLLPPGETAVFAGASGGIMGLLGGLWGHLLVGRYKQATPLVRSQFHSVSSFIMIQSVCDLMTPQVSMACHLLGLFTGIVGGVIVGVLGGRRRSLFPASLSRWH